MLSDRQAIIFSPTVTVVSEPTESANQLFVIHEGTKVKIIEESEQWYRISLPDGNDGWMYASALVII